MRFEITCCRTLNKQDIFSLKGTPHGTVEAIPREWTDRADPDPYQSLQHSSANLSFAQLLHLAAFIDILKAKPTEIKD